MAESTPTSPSNPTNDAALAQLVQQMMELQQLQSQTLQELSITLTQMAQKLMQESAKMEIMRQQMEVSLSGLDKLTTSVRDVMDKFRNSLAEINELEQAIEQVNENQTRMYEVFSQDVRNLSRRVRKLEEKLGLLPDAE